MMTIMMAPEAVPFYFPAYSNERLTHWIGAWKTQ